MSWYCGKCRFWKDGFCTHPAHPGWGVDADEPACDDFEEADAE